MATSSAAMTSSMSSHMITSMMQVPKNNKEGYVQLPDILALLAFSYLPVTNLYVLKTLSRKHHSIDVVRTIFMGKDSTVNLAQAIVFQTADYTRFISERRLLQHTVRFHGPTLIAPKRRSNSLTVLPKFGEALTCFSGVGSRHERRRSGSNIPSSHSSSSSSSSSHSSSSSKAATQDATVLVERLPHIFPNMKIVDLRGLKSGQLNAFLREAKTLHSLHTLKVEVAAISLDENSFRLMSEMDLEEIHLTLTQITSEFLKNLPQLVKLRTLKVQGDQHLHNGDILLMGACTSLTSLSFAHFTNLDPSEFSTLLSFLPRLVSLELDDCQNINSNSQWYTDCGLLKHKIIGGQETSPKALKPSDFRRHPSLQHVLPGPRSRCLSLGEKVTSPKAHMSGDHVSGMNPTILSMLPAALNLRFLTLRNCSDVLESDGKSHLESLTACQRLDTFTYEGTTEDISALIDNLSKIAKPPSLRFFNLYMDNARHRAVMDGNINLQPLRHAWRAVAFNIFNSK